MLNRLPYREIWLVDFEFNGDPGERPNPVCLVAWELRTGQKIRLWRNQFGSEPPYPTDENVLFVAYYASAEIACHLSLSWPTPKRILDLFVEFRNHTNGLTLGAGNSLPGALTFFGLDGIGAVEKKEMRDLILSGGPWERNQQLAILDYCASDVAALSKLLAVMVEGIDLPRALLRGRYMAAAGHIEFNGTPTDLPLLHRLRDKWTLIQDQLISEIDADYGVFNGRSFKVDRFERWLSETEIPWPTLTSGRLDLSDDAFKEMARIDPRVAPLRELRTALSEMRLNDLTVGRDGFNRCLLSAFSARTDRDQPSNTRFIFGPSVWLRCLIQPPPGYGIAYVDWEQQEFGIAAALSGDINMGEAYLAGDPYLSFAKQALAVPPDATKHSHPSERGQFKACALAVQYGMTEYTLATRLNKPLIHARNLIRLHHQVYSRFWQWSDNVVDHANLSGRIATVFAWQLHITENLNPRSLSNFPMQANGAEMLRLACCVAIEEGIHVCAPVHDAILIMAPLDQLDTDVSHLHYIMAEASRTVLNGFELRTEESIFRYPQRYVDKRGAAMWNRVMHLIDHPQPSALQELTL